MWATSQERLRERSGVRQRQEDAGWGQAAPAEQEQARQGWRLFWSTCGSCCSLRTECHLATTNDCRRERKKENGKRPRVKLFWQQQQQVDLVLMELRVWPGSALIPAKGIARPTQAADVFFLSSKILNLPTTHYPSGAILTSFLVAKWPEGETER